MSDMLEAALRYGAACKRRLVDAKLENANEQITAALFVEVERLRAELAECKRDAERYRWLTYDHDDAEQRKRCREIWDRGCVMSYSALSADIDAAMAGGK